ncbi:MAG TPA: glycoside hydrolase family 43 protein [Gemmatimonadaceae bacterium]|nr:glycoside hydrolase family 43 protein [Gemmatimonadaceae bacterium]
MPRPLSRAASAAALLPALLLLAPGCSGGGGNGTTPPPPATCSFTNPVASGADPWVVQRGGWYYLIQSRDNGIWVSKSENLSDVAGASAVRVWTAPATGWNRTNIWAPELHYLDGKWYIYYAGGESGPPFLYQRSGVLESVGDDPQGAYVDKGMLYTGDDLAGGTNNRWAIDVTVARLNGQLYAVWSGWESSATTDRTPQHTYIAPMSNPWTISGNRVKISSPTESWEVSTELALQEGPEFLLRGDDVFIIYSAAESWLPAYKLGQLKLQSATADPLSPGSWVKSGPVFSGTSGVYGVGHASFAKSPDGTEDWIIYHSKVQPSPGWDRVIRMQKFGWKPDGSPDFGTPGAANQTLTRPAGECD